MKKLISISLALMLSLSPMLVLADVGGVVAAPVIPAPYIAQMDQVEKLLAQAVYEGFTGIAPTLNDKVAELVRPKLEVIGQKVYAKVVANKASFDAITFAGPDLSAIISQIPPEAALNMIPAQFLDAAKAKAKTEVTADIRASFAKIPDEVDAAVRANLDKVSPLIIEDLKPYVKEIIFSTADLIDENISSSIDEEITNALPDLLELLPAEMDGLTPEEIAEHYMTKMEPAAEAAMRPALKAEIKALIDAQVEELIEKPISELMNPKIDQIGVDAVNSIIGQVPAYAKAFVPEAEIRAVVDEELAALRAKLPAMIDSEQQAMKAKIQAQIDAFINDNSKIYVDGKIANIKLKMLKSKAFINYTDVNKATGGKVVYSAKKKTITIKDGSKTVEFTLSSRNIKVNGKVIKNALEATEKPVLIGKIPELPMEAVAEQFGCELNYNPEWKMTTLGNN